MVVTNFIEAFDQPWSAGKKAPPAASGLYNEDRTPKFLLDGSGQRLPGWPQRPAISVALGIGILGLARVLATRAFRPRALLTSLRHDRGVALVLPSPMGWLVARYDPPWLVDGNGCWNP